MKTAGFFIQSSHTQNLKENMRRCELTTWELIFQSSISKTEIFIQSDPILEIFLCKLKGGL